ncbi:recombination protein RecR [bacterium]|nr:MAG: recombination protein RecR [bacterium]
MARQRDLQDGGEFQSPALERLVRGLSRLPGLGRKSATRIALHLVAKESPALELATAMAEARAQVTNCSRCGAITEPDPCRICTSVHRNAELLCVVATPVDVLPFEKAGFYRGRYFVLGGLLSPLDGVRADDLPFDRLIRRIDEDGVREMVMALDASVEGETTALYLQRLVADRDLRMTRLATGIPVGGALAYTDEITLQRAYQFRRSCDS